MQVRAAATLCAMLFLSGCSVITGPVSIRRQGESPALGNVTERSVGDVMYEVFDYREIQGINVTEIVNLGHRGVEERSHRLRIVSADNNGIKYEILSGLRAK